jgi:uncharacterized RDD family membrane protein YckC
LTTNLSSFESLPIADAVPPARFIASVWRRFLAYVIDGIILGILGTGAGTVFFDTFSRLGTLGRLVGFCVTVIYFASSDSSFGNGQTFGKHWLKLQVIDAQGHTISFARSFLRSVIFATPSFLYGLRLPETQTSWIVSSLIFLVILWVGGSNLYLIAFDHKTRQGLHDLAVGSYVANADDTGPVGAKPIANTMWAILGTLLVVASVAAGILNAKLEKMPPFPQMRQDAGAIERLEGVRRAAVRDTLLHSSSGGAKKNLVVSITLKSMPLDQEVFADEVAGRILQSDRNSSNYDQLSIRLFYGYDIGIAQRWNHQDFAHTPAEWRQRALGFPSTKGQAPTRQ